MKFKRYLQEEYAGSINAGVCDLGSEYYGGGYTEIFKNPSISEIREIIKQSKFNTIRFFIDLQNKIVYCWKADTIHAAFVEEFLHKEKEKVKNFIKGTAVFRSGKLSIANDQKDDLVGILAGQVSKVKYNYDWLNQWFDNEAVKTFGRTKKVANEI
jgi:hypothetical protein